MSDMEDFEIRGEIMKANDEQQIVFGWAYVIRDHNGVQQIDKSGEFVSDPEELEKSVYEFVLNSRVGGDSHVKKGVSTLVESTAITDEKMMAWATNPDGSVDQERFDMLKKALPIAWWTGWKIHDDEVWQLHKSGERSSFSVHGRGLRKKVSR